MLRVRHVGERTRTKVPQVVKGEEVKAANDVLVRERMVELLLLSVLAVGGQLTRRYSCDSRLPAVERILPCILPSRGEHEPSRGMGIVRYGKRAISRDCYRLPRRRCNKSLVEFTSSPKQCICLQGIMVRYAHWHIDYWAKK
nr:hypothetical protein CFP56_46796 [Quercus suber]